MRDDTNPAVEVAPLVEEDDGGRFVLRGSRARTSGRVSRRRSISRRRPTDPGIERPSEEPSAVRFEPATSAHRARARGTEHRRGATSDETRGIATVPAKAAEPAGRTRVERPPPRRNSRFDIVEGRIRSATRGGAGHGAGARGHRTRRGRGRGRRRRSNRTLRELVWRWCLPL